MPSGCKSIQFILEMFICVKLGNSMENYVGLEFVLGGLAVFSVGLFLGCVCVCTRKNKKTDVDYNEIELLKVTLKEIVTEKEEVENGIVERLEQLKALEKQQTSPLFFKSADINQMSSEQQQLQELHCNLVTELKSYPKFSEVDVKQNGYLEDFRLDSKKHHKRVGLAGEAYFNKIDRYINDLSESWSESNTLIVDGPRL